ncbi:hypothetical protein GBAR_LOCUS14685 [Geodia barretti]|uniref:Uncharacterized protein n=1 Tax=Geodia barretti TaxID=519541 RepID=A0AA35S8G4_GEOBA|nr:hypothetical protein GBAR_LOCUS14685 [Geodia barretti]
MLHLSVKSLFQHSMWWWITLKTLLWLLLEAPSASRML